MSDYKIGCDAHKLFSLFAVLDSKGQLIGRTRVNHERGAIRGFLSQFPKGTPVALETVGNWYWIVDEIEEASCLPRMAHAYKAKVMMGNVDKTDKLDAQGLGILLHNGTLPTVWLPPGEIRDQRELPRTRMAFSRLRTVIKNRIHATVAKYGLTPPTGLFSKNSQPWLQEALEELPPETRRCVQQELELLDQVQEQIDSFEARIRQQVRATPTLQLLSTLPGVGDILGIVIDRETGSIQRFSSCDRFASYCGTTPKVKASAGHVRYGHMRPESNHYLQWAFIEAANVAASHRHSPAWRHRHVTRLYERIRSRKGHAVAIGAVARHLAEATYWILTKGEPYREPQGKRPSGK
jgi:transposase